MAGLPVPFTTNAMGNVTRLQSSKKTSTCLEDTRIFLGVSKTSFLSLKMGIRHFACIVRL